MNQLAGKTALVTGATSGIGRAAARRFVEEGAFVFITGRRQAALDTTVAALGDNVRGVRGDVSRPDDLDEIYARVRGHGRGLDVLFANAGGGSFAALDQITEEHFDETFATNVRGTLFTVQKALPLLNEHASVILAGSTEATSATPAFGVYAASKAAIRSFARTWAARARVPAREGERRRSRADRDRGPARTRTRRGRCRRPRPSAGGIRAARSGRASGGGSQRRAVPGQRREQLRHGQRVVRRRRLSAAVNTPNACSPEPRVVT